MFAQIDDKSNPCTARIAAVQGLAMSPFTAFDYSHQTSLIPLALMRHIDERYLADPLATRRMLHQVARRGGHRIGHKYRFVDD